MEEYIDCSKIISTFINTSIRKDLVQKFRPGASVLYSFYYNHWFNVKFERDMNGIYNTDIFSFLDQKITDFILNTEDRVICISLGINKEFIEAEVGHQNLIIIRKFDNRFEHYEPNGSPSIAIFEKIKNHVMLLYYRLIRYLPELIFVDSKTLHPYNDDAGFQSLVSKGYDERGYCQFWCYLIIYLVMRFKEMKTEDIFYSIEDFNLTNKQANRRLKELIRGFVYISTNKIIELLDVDSEGLVLEDLFDNKKNKSLLLPILQTNHLINIERWLKYITE